MPVTSISQRTCLGALFDRMIYRTRVLVPGDQLTRLVDQVLLPDLVPGDIILLSSKAVSACQGRMLPVSSIHPKWLARLLARRWKAQRPASLSYPEAMQVAVEEAGSFALAFDTLAFGWRRWAGWQAAARSRPGASWSVRVGQLTDLPVYHGQIILPPREPQQLTSLLWKRTGYRAAIVSVRLPGQVQIVGLSHGLSGEYVRQIVLDNPLGRGTQQTPLAILRKRH